MKKTVVLFALGLVCYQSLAATPQAVCKSLQGAVADIQQQAPIAVDYMTTLTGAVALYSSSNNRCLLNYNYVIKAETFLQEMMAENQLTLAENVDVLKSDEGIASIQEVFNGFAKDAAKMHFQPFSGIAGITIHYSYRFDDYGIPGVVAVVMEN
ncbi:hypothetical protein JAO78_014585 [Alishewanella sp. 16-MA]|uniref:Uncharacterized protein n=1 Tax=Alishewanella maricola TaxID=2795740 RepID=A0ABS8C6T0_9ALTE|nr:hypothetical protein [Alishewanella maricola]MCB5228038.1 hypothetical protein [Alishewanella maricola]